MKIYNRGSTFAEWVADNIKVTHTDVTYKDLKESYTALTSTNGIHKGLKNIHEQFRKLYEKRAFFNIHR